MVFRWPNTLQMPYYIRALVMRAADKSNRRPLTHADTLYARFEMASHQGHAKKCPKTQDCVILVWLDGA